MRILFLSRWFPYPADNGSKLRISNLIRQLAVEHQVFLVSFRPPEREIDPEAEHIPASDCSEVYTAPYPGYRPTTIRALTGLFALQPRSLVATRSLELSEITTRVLRQHRCDLIIASELDMLPYALAQRDVPILLEDLELAVYRDALERHSSAPARFRARLTWFKLGAYLRRVLPRVAACTVVSEQEREHVQMIAPTYERVSVVPNAVDFAYYAGRHGEPQPNTLVFSGALSYSPNYDGLRWFLAEVFPRIQQVVPGVRLRVTGTTEGVDRPRLPGGCAVEYTGYVDDIRPVVAGSWVSVVPLWHGSGTRLKILEAMALGTPVVSTTKGAEGLSVTSGTNIILRDDPDGFARGVSEILRSSKLRDHLADGGRRLVQTRYDWQVVGADVRALVQGVAGFVENDRSVRNGRWQPTEHGHA